MNSTRDLACEDLWADSLARSLARRGIETDRTPRELIRDLADPAFWAAADWRSQYRREIAEAPLLSCTTCRR